MIKTSCVTEVEVQDISCYCNCNCDNSGAGEILRVSEPFEFVCSTIPRTFVPNLVPLREHLFPG